MSAAKRTAGGGGGGGKPREDTKSRPDNKQINMSKFFVLISTDRVNPWSASGMVDGSHLVSDFLVDHMTEKIYKSMGLEPNIDEQQLHLLDARFEYYSLVVTGHTPSGTPQRKWVPATIQAGVTKVSDLSRAELYVHLKSTPLPSADPPADDGDASDDEATKAAKKAAALKLAVQTADAAAKALTAELDAEQRKSSGKKKKKKSKPANKPTDTPATAAAAASAATPTTTNTSVASNAAPAAPRATSPPIASNSANSTAANATAAAAAPAPVPVTALTQQPPTFVASGAVAADTILATARANAAGPKPAKVRHVATATLVKERKQARMKAEAAAAAHQQQKAAAATPPAAAAQTITAGATATAPPAQPKPPLFLSSPGLKPGSVVGAAPFPSVWARTSPAGSPGMGPTAASTLFSSTSPHASPKLLPAATNRQTTAAGATGAAPSATDRLNRHHRQLAYLTVCVQYLLGQNQKAAEREKQLDAQIVELNKKIDALTAAKTAT